MQNVDNDEPQIDENDECTRLLTSDKDEDIQNGIGYVLKLLCDLNYLEDTR